MKIRVRKEGDATNVERLGRDTNGSEKTRI